MVDDEVAFTGDLSPLLAQPEDQLTRHSFPSPTRKNIVEI